MFVRNEPVPKQCKPRQSGSSKHEDKYANACLHVYRILITNMLDTNPLIIGLQDQARPAAWSVRSWCPVKLWYRLSEGSFSRANATAILLQSTSERIGRYNVESSVLVDGRCRFDITSEPRRTENFFILSVCGQAAGMAQMIRMILIRIGIQRVSENLWNQKLHIKNKQMHWFTRN